MRGLLGCLRLLVLVSCGAVGSLLGCDTGSSSADGAAGADASASGAGGTGSSGGTAGSAAGATPAITAGTGTAAGGAGLGGTTDVTEGGVFSAAGGGGADSCAQPQIMYVISRAGTMFLGEPAPWVAIQEASLAALKSVEGSAELGFLAVTGEADLCPVLEEVAPAPSSYQAIASKYSALAAPQKGESPFMQGLRRAGELLNGAAEKYIVFVLNGEADFCSDGFPGCATDSVVAAIQELHAAGITTLVVSAPAPLVAGEERVAAYEAALQGYANAGVGLPVESHTEPTTLNIMCAASIDSGGMAWRAELDASGKPDDATLAVYSEAADDAPYLRLEDVTVTGVEGLTNALSTLLEGIAICR
jgi:hypothetical protein